MASKIPEPIASFRTTLTNKITSSATTIYIDSYTDDDGTSMNGEIIQCVLDKGKSTEEFILGTVDSATSSLISCTRGLSVVDGVTAVAGNQFAHAKKSTIEISDHPALAMVVRRMNGTDSFDADNRPYADVDQDATSDAQFVTAGQLARTALGTVSSSKAIAPGTAGETIAVDQLVYFKSSDQRWWLADADVAASVENVILGISRGAGTAGNAITSGVHLFGEHIAASAIFTVGKVFASNTAGGFSSSAGTKEVSLGGAYTTTKIYFSPRFEQMLTEDEQDALAGTSGTPSASNKFVTAEGLTAVRMFGGTGADGALSITSGTTTIDCANAAIVVKNYTSISITGTGALAFSNPHANGTVIILRSQGAVVITTSATRAIDLRGMGAAGGQGGQTAAAEGATGSNPNFIIDALSHGGGGTSSGPGAGGVAYSPTALYSDSANDVLLTLMRLVTPGAGGGGGQSYGTGNDIDGGNGGRGSGSLIIESVGAYNCTGTIDASGSVGVAGTDLGGGSGGAGGGGGGAGGMVLVMYNSLTGDSGTYTVSGGAGGAGSNNSGGTGGDGGGGAGSVVAAGSIGTANSSGNGGAGGAGANGIAVRMANTCFF